ncbi:expressed unknown protein [Seminavis robusta]|uniref:Uncharacterized protein n=1 Tax=Seminavis robusta TaxID=568900 RepID=A0A9N8H0S7_9STRA|nr:expressed unknown protein [Seminavis robusta]|eukprot:Sro26_g017560.1 n/a (353) ;mRNA; f:56812-58391
MATSPISASSPKVDSDDFYSEYFGHKEEHLQQLLPLLRSSSDSLVWLAGDSSLDNKYWFQLTQPAVGGYRDLLDPPRSKTDIAYWMNFLALEDPSNELPRIATINTAVEETTLNQRTWRWLPQDKFIRDKISPDDILIVSAGGNDVAWAPCPCTIVSILCLLNLPMFCIENAFNCGSVPTDDYCCGCGASLASCACACPPCSGYFKHLFGTRVQKYVESLVAKTKPKAVLICMIYFPDEAKTMSWATLPLQLLGYESNPSKLQLLIRKAFQDATLAIKIPGTKVIPVPLYEVLDGKHSEEYCERVEPSPSGGKLLARLFLMIIRQQVTGSSQDSRNETAIGAPVSQAMAERS